MQYLLHTLLVIAIALGIGGLILLAIGIRVIGIKRLRQRPPTQSPIISLIQLGGIAFFLGMAMILIAKVIHRIWSWS